MTLLKKAIDALAENCGGMDQNDTAGTQLLSFLVRRNQAEEEEGSDESNIPKSNMMRMVGDDDGELDFDSAEDTTDYSDDQDELDSDEEDINLDVKLDIGDDLEDQDDDDDIEGELSRLKSLLP